jgi:TonB family protein
MLYTLLLGALITLIAAGVERIAVTLRRPVRFIWAAAMLACVVAPVVAAAWRALGPGQPAVQLLPFVIDVQRATAITTTANGPTLTARLDALLIAAWVLGSALLLARLVLATRRLRRAAAEWRRSEVDGVEVQLAPDAGPAVVGIRSMRVVLPEWILDLDQSLRAIVLRHEEEHRSARDPYLLFGSALALALMPWNIALWWQARRLRLAIEMDCDARVLRAHPIPERYGLLLLTIAQRRSMMPSMLAPMLSEPASHLERRIVAMRTTQIARLSIATGAGLAVLALGFACTVRSPDNLTGPRQSPQRATAPIRVYDTTTFREFQVENEAQPITFGPAPRYPDSLRVANVEGEVVAQFVVDTTGRIDMSTFKALKESHPEFTAAVRSALPNMKFVPASVGGRKVKQLVQMPFQFNLSKTSATAGAPVRPQPARDYIPIKLDSTAVRPQPARDYISIKLDSTPSRPQSGVNTLETVITTAVGERRTGQPSLTVGTNQSVSRQQFGARPRTGNPAPRYPDALRAAGIEGEVVTQFVVNADGSPDMQTLKVLKATDPQFVDAVKSALAQMRFDPAELNGRPVRQLTQMPFQFTLGKP